MSKSSDRRRRRERQQQLREGTADPTYPYAPPPLPDSSMIAGFINPQPAPTDPAEDIRLARELIQGGWESPAPGIARLLLRLGEAADPDQPITSAIAAVNAVTRVFDHVVKNKLSRKIEDSLAARLSAAMEVDESPD